MPSWKKVIISGSDAALNSLNVSTSFTASGLIYPTTDGTTGQVLITDGDGNLSFSPVENTTIIIKNVSGATIQKGTPCYITGSGTSGNLAGVWPADAGNPLRMPAGVIAGETLTAGAEGVGLINGFIGNVNTSAFSSGQSIYVAVGGGYTNVKPTGSSVLIQKLGNVEKSSASNGSGVINGPAYYNEVPNIQQGFTWVGNSDGVAVAVATSSIQNVISASFSTTSSYALNAGASFPYTGSAAITGSLTVTGSIIADSFIKSGGTSDQYLKADGSVSTALNSRIEVNFIATAGQTTFTTPYDIGQVEVYYNGSKLYPDEFIATNGTTIELVTPATLDAQISIVKYVASFTTTAIRNETTFTTIAGQTTFFVNYAVGQVDVFYNGSKLNSREFTAIDGTSITLDFACQADESIVIVSYVNQVSGASGTTNRVAKFTGAASLGDSQIFDNGTNVGIGKDSANAKLDVNGNTIITGSLTVITGSNIEFQVTNTGVKIGNIISDNHTVTGSLRVTGSITGTVQLPDSSATASSINVGSMRYRTSGNNSYVDMVMQTGASTYEWVNIVQNIW
jgi:hypothetical protein